MVNLKKETLKKGNKTISTYSLTNSDPDLKEVIKDIQGTYSKNKKIKLTVINTELLSNVVYGILKRRPVFDRQFV